MQDADTFAPLPNILASVSGTTDAKQRVEEIRPSGYRNLKLRSGLTPQSVLPNTTKNRSDPHIANTSNTVLTLSGCSV